MAIDIGSIVARLVLDRQDFSDGLAAARAEAREFPDVHVALDTSRFDSGMARVAAEKARAAEGVESRISFDVGHMPSFDRTLSGLIVPGGSGGHSGTPLTEEGMARLVERIIAAGSERRIDIFYHASGEGAGGGGSGGLLAALGAFFGGGGAGGKTIGLGGGLLGMATAGSLASFAGLGVEHLVMTLIGLAGSAAGGVLGGGLLALGSAGKLGVGMGSDAAVMSSTIADTKTLSTDYANLANAVAVYGKNSQQAQQAQAQLNADMKALGDTAGVKAEAGLARASASLNQFWDTQTSAARVRAVNILDQVLNLGRDYVPRVAQAAYMNLGIIDNSIKPLFTWLEGPQGVGIFNDLENRFRHELPTAIHAFDQGVELFIKTIDLAAGSTGGFMVKLDHFLTRMNSPTGFSKSWAPEIHNLIGDFHLWEGLVVALTTDIYRLFHNDAHTASSIVTYLTQMLDKLGAWEASTRGSAQLHNIFEVHKQEIMALLSLLPPLITSFSHIYMTVAPGLTTAFTDALRAVEPFISLLAHFEPTAWLLGLTLIAAKLGVLGPAVGIARQAFEVLIATIATRIPGAGAAIEALRGILMSPWTWGGAAVIGGLILLNHAFQGAYASTINASKAMANTFVASVQQSQVPLSIQIQNIKDQIKAIDGSTNALNAQNTAIQKTATGGLGFSDTLQNNTGKIEGNSAALKILNTALQNLQGQQQQQVSLSSLLTGKNATFANSMYVTQGATNQASSALTQYNSLLQVLVGNTQSATGAQITVRQDLLNVSGALHTAGATMSGTNQQSLQLQQAVLGFAQSLTGQYMPALAQAGTSTKSITGLSEGFVKQLDAMLKAAGYTPAVIQAVNKQFGITNPNLATAAGNLASVTANANLAKTALGQIPSVTIHVDSSQLVGAVGYAYALTQSLAQSSGQEARLAGAAARQQAQHRAAGGPVVPGETYIVGEKGPEPFMPSVPGTILPNSVLSGGGSSSKSVEFTLNDHRSVTITVGSGDSASAIRQAVCDELEKHDDQLMSTLHDLGVMV